MGLPGLCASSCVLPVYVAGQRRFSPGLMLGFLVLSSHDGTCDGRRSLLFRSDLSSDLDVMQRHAHSDLFILIVILLSLYLFCSFFFSFFSFLALFLFFSGPPGTRGPARRGAASIERGERRTRGQERKLERAW